MLIKMIETKGNSSNFLLIRLLTYIRTIRVKERETVCILIPIMTRSTP